jgi:hypothetical protein
MVVNNSMDALWERGGEAILRWIKDRLHWSGQVRRQDLKGRFQLSPQQASNDLSEYVAAAAEQAFDQTTKVHVRAKDYRPIFRKRGRLRLVHHAFRGQSERAAGLDGAIPQGHLGRTWPPSQSAPQLIGVTSGPLDPDDYAVAHDLGDRLERQRRRVSPVRAFATQAPSVPGCSTPISRPIRCRAGDSSITGTVRGRPSSGTQDYLMSADKAYRSSEVQPRACVR